MISGNSTGVKTSEELGKYLCVLRRGYPKLMENTEQHRRKKNVQIAKNRIKKKVEKETEQENRKREIKKNAKTKPEKKKEDRQRKKGKKRLLENWE